MMNRLSTGFLLVLILPGFLFAQDTIFLKNPSFEDQPGHSKVPVGWLNAGFPGESPPDIGPTTFFRASTVASEGQSHLVLIARDVGTWERVANPLSTSLKAGQCYEFQIDLARSAVYLSRSRFADSYISFTRPVRLRIWGSQSPDTLSELLALTPLVQHTDWQRYTFQLQVQQSCSFLILEVMYEANAPVPYAGNLLLDNASHLIPVSNCPDQQEQLKVWAAEPVPVPDPSYTPETGRRSMTLVDSLEVIPAMEKIADGHIDIGLYDLATYARLFETQPWILLLSGEKNRSGQLLVKRLKKRIRAMHLHRVLKVKHLKPGSQNLKFAVSFEGRQLGISWD